MGVSIIINPPPSIAPPPAPLPLPVAIIPAIGSAPFAKGEGAGLPPGGKPFMIFAVGGLLFGHGVNADAAEEEEETVFVAVAGAAEAAGGEAAVGGVDVGSDISLRNERERMR